MARRSSRSASMTTTPCMRIPVSTSKSPSSPAPRVCRSLEILQQVHCPRPPRLRFPENPRPAPEATSRLPGILLQQQQQPCRPSPRHPRRRSRQRHRRRPTPEPAHRDPRNPHPRRHRPLGLGPVGRTARSAPRLRRLRDRRSDPPARIATTPLVVGCRGHLRRFRSQRYGFAARGGGWSHRPAANGRIARPHCQCGGSTGGRFASMAKFHGEC